MTQSTSSFISATRPSVDANACASQLIDRAHGGDKTADFFVFDDTEVGFVDVVFLAQLNIPMGFMSQLPAVSVCALAKHVRLKVLWPEALFDEQKRTCVGAVSAQAAFAEGLVAAVIIRVAAEVTADRDAHVLVDCVRDALDVWCDACVKGVAGPLAPLADEYFEALALKDEPAELFIKGSQTSVAARLRGIDIWGRATFDVIHPQQVLEDVAAAQAQLIGAC